MTDIEQAPPVHQDPPETPAVTPGTPAAEPITFTAEQQKFIDTILAPRLMGKAARDLRQELAQTKQKLQTTEAALKAQSPDSSETERLKAQLELQKQEVAAVKQAASEAQKNADIQSVATRLGFVDPALMNSAFGKNIQRGANGSYQILSDDGSVRDGVTLEAYLTEIASQRLYLVKGQTIGGTGSTGSTGSTLQTERYDVAQIFGKNSNSSLANQLSLKNPREYQRLKQIARERGLI